MNLVFSIDDKNEVIFEQSLVTAEMFCIAQAAYHYYVDLQSASKDDVSVIDRIRSGETQWLFECCAALYRFKRNGEITKYDVITHSEMRDVLKHLPYSMVEKMKETVEFFFQLQPKSLSQPIQPSKQRIIAAMAEKYMSVMMQNQIQHSKTSLD